MWKRVQRVCVLHNLVKKKKDFQRSFWPGGKKKSLDKESCCVLPLPVK